MTPEITPARSSYDTIDDVRAKFGAYSLYRVCPDWCSSGLWAPPEIGTSQLGGNIVLDNAFISARLKKRLADWQDRFDAQNPPRKMMSNFELHGFEAEGLNIARLLSAELDGRSIVEYAAWSPEHRLLFGQGECLAVFTLPKLAA